MVLLNEVCQRRPVYIGEKQIAAAVRIENYIRAISNRHENTPTMESSTAVKVV